MYRRWPRFSLSHCFTSPVPSMSFCFWLSDRDSSSSLAQVHLTSRKRNWLLLKVVARQFSPGRRICITLQSRPWFRWGMATLRRTQQKYRRTIFEQDEQLLSFLFPWYRTIWAHITNRIVSESTVCANCMVNVGLERKGMMLFT